MHELEGPGKATGADKQPQGHAITRAGKWSAEGDRREERAGWESGEGELGGGYIQFIIG